MGIHDRDWYAEHHGAKPKARKRRFSEASRPQPAAVVFQAPPRGRQRPTTWLDRNWWRLIWCAVFAVVLAALARAVIRAL